VDIPLVGDAQTILVELVYHLHRAIRDGQAPRSTWGIAPRLRRGHDRYLHPELRTSRATPMSPARWRCDLEEVLPEQAIVFSDIGGHMLWNIHYLCMRGAQRFYLNLGFGSMGHGTAAPIGAALAEPGRPVFAIVGDACFTMNGMELITAAEHRLPIIWIVENNDMQGITYHGSRMLSPTGQPLRSSQYLRKLEVAAIARAMGLSATVVDRPGQLQDAVRAALARNEPSVIEVRVDALIPPPIGERAKSLAGFIEQ
jgi:acetolactate synthase-1/2/3 large subunit